MCATSLSLFELLITTASLSGDRLADRSPQPSKSADPPWSSRPSSRLALRRSKSLCVQANGDRPRCRSPRIPQEPEESCTGAQPRLISHLGEATASYCACRLTWIRRIADPSVLEESEASCEGAQPRFASLRRSKNRVLLARQRGPAGLPVPARSPKHPAQVRSLVSPLARAKHTFSACKPQGTGLCAALRVLEVAEASCAGRANPSRFSFWRGQTFSCCLQASGDRPDCRSPRPRGAQRILRRARSRALEQSEAA